MSYYVYLLSSVAWCLLAMTVSPERALLLLGYCVLGLAPVTYCSLQLDEVRR